MAEFTPEDAAPAAFEPAAESGAPATARTCVIIPMFNEASVIADVVARLRERFPHVVCVDDGSTDSSADVAAAAGAAVVHHPVNLGQGAALQTGFAFALAHPAHYDYFVTFDADGQHQVSDAAAMVSAIESSGVDVVLGSRFLEGGANVPTARRLLLRAAISFTRFTTRLPVTDTHTGLRAFRRDAAETLNLRMCGMAHASEILSHIAYNRLSLVEVPVQITYSEYARRKGQSSINALNIAFDLMLDRIRFAR